MHQNPVAEHWLTQVVDNPDLDDLPYRIETNQYLEILMSPAKNPHSHRQLQIARWFIQQAAFGQVELEWSLLTADGVKVPDVVWISPARFAEHGLTTPYPIAPEICVEVLSPSNSRPQMHAKARLYFDAGAHEVWLVDPEGRLEVIVPAGPRERSLLFPQAPEQFG